MIDINVQAPSNSVGKAPIAMVVSDLQERVSALHSQVDYLETRLDPCLMPHTESTAEPSLQDVPGSSGLARCLADLSNSVHMATMRIIRVVDRIEL